MADRARHRFVVLGNIVDEHGAAGRVIRHDLRQCAALWPLVGIDRHIQPQGLQLPRARRVAVVEQIGQHHHVRFALQLRHRFQRAGDGGLASHLIIEEQVEIGPHLRLADGHGRIAPTEALREGIAIQQEIDPVRLVQPFAEVAHHVQQHFIAIGDHQWTAHPRSSSLAAASAAGDTPSASAASIRSGSCAHRKSSTARWVAGLPSESRRRSGVSPVKSSRRSARRSSARTHPSARRASRAGSCGKSSDGRIIVANPD
jgi:hypothetical protein